MSDEYNIRVDDLILFFKALDDDEKEVIVNRLVPHRVYTDGSRRVLSPEAKWDEVVLSEPTVPSDQSHHYYVANLAKLLLPDGAPAEDTEEIPEDFWSDASEPGQLASGDLVVFPPDQPSSWFHIPRKVIEEKCRQLPPRDVSDLEFMATEEGAVMANVPKVVPEGCTCILLSLVGLRSGMLSQAVRRVAEDKVRAEVANAPELKTLGAQAVMPKTIVIKAHDTRQYVDKNQYATLMPDHIRRGHKR